MNNEIDYRIKKILSEVFNVSVDAIDSTASPRTIKSWKGQNHLKMVEVLETEFGIKFEESEVESLISFKIIRATVLAYLD